MADASVLDLRLATAIDPANLHPQLLPDPNVVQDPNAVGGYDLSDASWYGRPQQEFAQMHQELPQEAGAATDTPEGGDEQARLEAARQRRQRAREREETRPGFNALLPDEVPLEPPHDPDETVPIPFTRPCSMARPDIPPGLRCVVMLKPDYNYRMCEGCRMRFKLTEVRANGIRYDGKKKAKGTPSESHGQKHKVRPQLIQYNGELVLDPAYMHTYSLDLRMFGPEGQLKNMAANEKASFSKALKNATCALQGSRSKSREAGMEEGMPEQVATPSEAPEASPNVVGPLSTPGPTSGEDPKDFQPAANDGLLRVRICSVKTCHTPVPIDYHWKMCETCRVNYRKWGIEKRDRMRERRLNDMPQEERDKYLTLSNGKKAQQESNKSGGPSIVEVQIPFDPTIPPRPCSVGKCKNHVPGNSGYKRCPVHRKESRVYASSYAKKRELQKEVYQKALEEGRDPEAALKEYIAQTSKHDSSDDDDGEVEIQEVEVSKKKRKGKSKKTSEVIDPILLESPFTTSTESVPKRPSMPPPSMRRIGHICSGKDCANLLDQTYAWRLCELCREAEKAKRPPPKPKKKEETTHQQSSSTDSVDVSNGGAPVAEPGGMAHTFVHHAIASSSASGPQVSVDTNTAHNWGSGYTMNQEPGSMQWFAFNPPPAYRTPESSLQHAITPPVANAAFHSTTNIVSDQPTGPPDQPGSVSTTTLQMSSSQPPANVQSLRSEPALFSTTPLPFSKPPDVASRSGSADPSKPISSRKRKTAQRVQEKLAAQAVAPAETTSTPSSSSSSRPQLPQGHYVSIMPAPPPARGPTFSVTPQPAQPQNTIFPSPRRQRKRMSTEAATTVPPTNIASSMLVPLQPPGPPPGYPYGYGGYPPSYNYAPPYMPPNGAHHWYQGYHHPQPPHGHYPPPMAGPGPLGYDTHGRHPYPFRYPYMPPPPQHGVAPWAPGQEPANQPSSTYVSTGQLVERPRSANDGRGSTIGASSPVGPIDEPEMDIPQPHDEPSQPEQGNETPPAIRDVSPEATAKDAPPITPSPGPYEPAVRSTYDAFWSNLKRVNVSEMASQRIPRASMQDNTSFYPVQDEDGIGKVSKAPKKTCDSPACSAVLPKSHPFKLCNECRKKQKLKKRMGEMKRRMKLVGSSKAGTSKSKIARSVSAHADSDVDAEGDIDMDG